MKIGNHVKGATLCFFVDGKIALETGATVETWRAASLQHPPSELKTGKGGIINFIFNFIILPERLQERIYFVNFALRQPGGGRKENACGANMIEKQLINN
jgi:hypothetical protein